MYIVTGGAGFIGSAVVKKLNDEGITDILIVDCLQKSENWKNLVGKKYIDYLHKDLFLELVAEDAIHEHLEVPAITAIIHMGACSSTTEEDMDYLMENNVNYTKVLTEFSIHHEIRFIYASSAATYGAGELGYSDDLEHIEKLKPMNRYGYSKQLVDEWILRKGYQELVCGLKFFNVYGPNEYHKESMRSVVCVAFEQLKKTGKMKLFKSNSPKYQDGEQKRDFVYVKDCSELIWALINNPEVNGIYNVGTGTARTWNELVASVCSALEIETSIEYIDMPKHLEKQYQNFTEAEMTNLLKKLPDFTFRTLEAGAKDYVCNYLNKDYLTN